MTSRTHPVPVAKNSRTSCIRRQIEHRLSRFERPPFSITRFDDRYTEAKFSKFGVWDKVPEGNTLIFGDTRISFQQGVG